MHKYRFKTTVTTARMKRATGTEPRFEEFDGRQNAKPEKYPIANCRNSTML